MSNFNFCPLIWMYHGKTSNNRVDRVQSRALRILHNDFKIPYKALLERANDRKIRIKNLQKLMLQIFQCLSKEGPSFMWTFFERKHIKYELRTTNLLQIPKRKTNTYGVNSFVFKGVLLWNTLPDAIENANSTAIFKREIKKWNGVTCNCKTCN